MFQIADPQMASSGMSWKTCALLIASAGAIGGTLNAYLSDHGIALPTRVNGVLCPGIFGNIFVGAVSSIVSWAFYGSGAAIDLADATPRTVVSVRLTALAGALMVGVAGAKWLTNEVDKTLLRKTVLEVAPKTLTPQKCAELQNSDTPKRMLQVATSA